MIGGPRLVVGGADITFSNELQLESDLFPLKYAQAYFRTSEDMLLEPLPGGGGAGPEWDVWSLHRGTAGPVTTKTRHLYRTL